MAASSSKQPRGGLPAAKRTAELKASKPSKTTSRKGKGREPVLADSTNAQGSVVGGEGEGVAVWNWVSLTESAVSKCSPVFTKNGSYFFSLVGASVKVHSTTTGRIVSTLTAPCPEGRESRSQALTCAIINPQNAFQLITGSLNGCISVWDFMEATLLQVFDIEKPIHHLCAHHRLKDVVFVTTTKTNRGRKDESGAVLRVSLLRSSSTSKLVQKPEDVLSVGKTRSPMGLALSPSGDWLVAIGGNTSYVAATSALQSGFTKFVSPEHLTCLAFHPTEEYYATGDSKGCVRLWYCIGQNPQIETVGLEKKSQTSSFHWHAHAVASIAFTSNGAYLLSGGEESVLVIWQVHTGRKEFVPRVGAAINAITVLREGDGPEEYLLGLVDATYLFINPASLKVSRTFSQIKLDPSSSTTHSNDAPLAIHRLTSTIVLPSSHPSSLQVYAPFSSELVSEIEISPSNRISRRDETPIEAYRVENTQISASGEWMVTLDCRAGDENFRGDIFLKFWKWHHKPGVWILNTRIDHPHDLGAVTSMAFKSSDSDDPLQLVTTGADSHVKIWRLKSIKTPGEVEESWVIRSAIKFKDGSPSHASWSHDGSILAASCGPHVALYEPSTSAFLCNLTSPQCKNITSAYFIGRSARYLAAMSPVSVTLWDIVSQTVRWRFVSSQSLDFLVPHSTCDSFVLMAKPTESVEQPETCAWTFDVSSSVPTSTQRLPYGFRNVMWYSLPFVAPTSASNFRLVGITRSWGVVIMGQGIQPLSQGSPGTERLSGEAPAKKTLFQDVFGVSLLDAVTTASASVEEVTRSRRRKERRTLVDGPTHSMPPLDTVFDTFVDFVIQERAAPALPNKGDSSHDMEVEEAAEDPVVRERKYTRIVDDAEMQVFVDLFKRQAIDHVRPRTTHVNGHATRKANGTTNGNTNGAHHRTPQPPKPTDPSPNKKGTKSSLQPTTPMPTVMPSPSPSPINGRKRKKSLD
ncbi:NET1-associated nuclear protein 1 [Pleurotus ostreatus]|nr:NET1-associated nuclear protein 1 [Pleurotus ostreatus]